MIYKNFILKLRLLLILLTPSIAHSQFCPNAVEPPTTINGIKVTDTSTGSVTIYPNTNAFTSCNLYTAPANSFWLGAQGAFTYTMNFSLPIDSLNFVLIGGGAGGGGWPPWFEVFTLTTNAGTPSIIDQGSCFTTITNNVIKSGQRDSIGGGNFTLVNATPFTSLTISGPGGQAGSFFAVCANSIETRVDTIERICAGDSVLIQGNYEKVAGLYSDTIFGGSATNEDSIIDTYLIVDTVSIHLGNDTTICQGDILTLDASTPDASYLWQDNSTDSTFNVTKQGTYWVELTVNGCTASDTIVVAVKPISVDLGNDTTICQGDTIALDVSTSNASYLWQDNSTNAIFDVSQPGTYWVELTVDNCTATDTILIKKNPTSVDLGNDIAICKGETIALDASTPNASYLWQDNSTDSTFNVTKQGRYWVQVTVNKCSVTDTILISEEDCEILLRMPNVFTPNGDGINDLFTPIESKGIVSTHTIIYNRWGERLFETNSPNVGWSAKSVSEGVYFWTIYYTDIKGLKNKLSGYVTVLK